MARWSTSTRGVSVMAGDSETRTRAVPRGAAALRRGKVHDSLNEANVPAALGDRSERSGGQMPSPTAIIPPTDTQTRQHRPGTVARTHTGMNLDPQMLRSEQHVEVGLVIQRDAGILIDRWVRRAIQEQPHAARAHHESLLDHLPRLLQTLGQ